jgi:hypothetical protein
LSLTIIGIPCIGSFPHFAADGGDDRVGCWLDGRIDLERVYSQIWNDTAPAHVIDVAVFCDSDDTHTASISYFASSISYFAYCPA